MSPHDVRRTLELVTEYWPRNNWPQGVRQDFARRLKALPIDGDQAQAALLEVRMTKPFKTCEPSDLLGQLMTAAKPARRPEQSTAREDEAKTVRAFKQADPGGFRALCEELHRVEPRTPPHYRHVPSSYAEWPVSRAWLAEQIRRRGLLGNGADGVMLHLSPRPTWAAPAPTN